jgi:hypothetical protein
MRFFRPPVSNARSRQIMTDAPKSRPEVPEGQSRYLISRQ